MRRKVSLYIADRLVDLDDQSFILFNYTMEDLSNPTIVRNSFSQQVTLKGTPNNNRIFGDIFRLDRETQYGDSYTGAFFDVTRKTPFAIYNEMSEIVESGYLKLDEVSRNGKMVEYKVTLYGGLGSFFYGLSYNEDGTPMTLADLRFKMVNGEFTRTAGHFGQVGGYSMLQDCWAYLADPEGYDINEYDCWWANIINFAPCYNGLPDKFSADKALVTSASYANMPTMNPKSGASSNLMVMANKHTEWEMKDLRWYLQRPIVSVKALFDAVCDSENNGGWNVSAQFDESLLNAWITLPLIPSEDRQKEDAIVRLLASSKSPAEYLISFAKVFGLVFLCDSGNKTITIMHRSQFFAGQETIDMTDKIDVRGIKISPLLAQSRYYQFGGGAIGEWAKTYKEDFGRDYAIQRVNTGNEFNQETTIVTDGITFKDAVDVHERNLLFVTEVVTSVGTEFFRLPQYERVFVQSWSGEEVSEVDVPYNGTGSWFYNNLYFRLSDWLPKVQFHEADDKAVDGADVLLLFNGVKQTPVWRDWARLQYRLTDDTPDMETLNEGEPCWNFTNVNSRILTQIPSFRRSRTTGDESAEVIDATLEWGLPLARATNGTSEGESVTIYDRYWKAYQQDRYDDDTFKMTCKVNLRGLRVGQELMRNFFYYDGALFVLNAIRNHSLTTWDDTECEFIRVQDKTNYTK